MVVPMSRQASKAPLLGFASTEIKGMSRMRLEKTRLPDILQYDQQRGHFRPEHRAIFLAYIQQQDRSKADVEIVNTVDDQPTPPFDFAFTNGYVYDKKVIGEPSLHLNAFVSVPARCDCDDDKCDPRTCACQKLHREMAPEPWKDLPEQFAYTEQGKLHRNIIELDNTPIWECTKLCGCRGQCVNRVVGKRRQVAINLCRIPNKGWGLRAGQDMDAGLFISIYAGELIDEIESNKRCDKYEEVGTSYILDVDPWYLQYNTFLRPFKLEFPGVAGQYDGDTDENLMEVAREWYVEKHGADPMFTVDAGLWGNLSRFLNHSCDPNLNLHPVYTIERDLRRPFWAFFTRRKVSRGEELTFKYTSDDTDASQAVESLKNTDEVRNQAPGTELCHKTTKMGNPDADGETLTKMHILRSLKCQCGAANCRGTVFRRG